ncbi:hypothetical protein I8J32_016060 [Lysobacter solisilvae]|uniref:Uncharacterized protein n=2 Tax=Agrilutibacter solisilvae TaxID=2763317 RepID=A0A974Y3X6_9GAMM|nr:hypothetical protein [Lysobacter solisilvae]QSX80115.1 hypothetical protein I8J32_016060 [Lysobacter solisilvae]
MLAAVCVLMSEMPTYLAVPLAALALIHAAHLSATQWKRPLRRLVVPHSAAPATIDGVDMDGLQVYWRGPLAVLVWRGPDGRRHRLHGWPDTLRRPVRRELRLALAARGPARVPRSVAP